MTPERLHEIALFVKMHGVEAALGRYPEARATVEAIGISYRLLPKKGLRWSDSWDDLLGTASDKAIAKRLKVPLWMVVARHHPFAATQHSASTDERRTNWSKDWDSLLVSEVSDEQLAEQLNVPLWKVAIRRQMLDKHSSRLSRRASTPKRQRRVSAR